MEIDTHTGATSIVRYEIRTVERCHKCAKPVYEGKVVEERTYHGTQSSVPVYTVRVWHEECFE